jgi:hypothetical protein
MSSNNHNIIIKDGQIKVADPKKRSRGGKAERAKKEARKHAHALAGLLANAGTTIVRAWTLVCVAGCRIGSVGPPSLPPSLRGACMLPPSLTHVHAPARPPLTHHTHPRTPQPTARKYPDMERALKADREAAMPEMCTKAPSATPEKALALVVPMSPKVCGCGWWVGESQQRELWGLPSWIRRPLIAVVASACPLLCDRVTHCRVPPT